MAAERAAQRKSKSPVGESAAPAELTEYLAKSGAKDVDRLVYERVRLGILSALAVNENLSFTELRSLLGASDGNLSVHARKLEEAAYIACKKGYEGRVPKTEYRITAKGRKALGRYLDHMEALIEAMRGGE